MSGLRWAALLALAGWLAACAGAGPAGVLTRGGSGAKPRSLGLLYPQIEAGALMVRGEWPGGRRFMGSEILAVVHAAIRGNFNSHAAPEWRDLAEEKTGRERIALLTTAMLREYTLNGTIPVRLANELGRVAHVDAVVLVSIARFGPSDRQMVLHSLAGDARPTGAAGAGSWINCGVVCAVVKTPGGQLLWEGGALESVPSTAGTTEAAAQSCVTRLMSAFPWRK